MASAPRPLPWILFGAFGTAALLGLGFWLDPVWWLMWLAPIPMLTAVPRLGFWAALLTAEAAWLGGTARIWAYLADSLETPPAFVIASAAVLTGLYTAATLLYRLLIRRGRHWTAFFAFPAGVVAVEYAGSLINADAGGEWWSLAYTQAGQTAILQLASVTGVWGITYLLTALPTAAATILAPGSEPRRGLGIAGVAAACLAAALVWGVARPADQGPTIRAGALALPAHADSLRIDTEEGEELFADYTRHIENIGARNDLDVLVLSEKIFHVTAEETGPYLDRWSDLAVRARIDLVLGLALDVGGDTYNAAVWIPSNGHQPATYFKQHLVPGLEDWMTASDTGPASIPGVGGGWSMTVCKDLDHAATMAEYGDEDFGLVLAPALDFGVDGWWHSRVAVTRGVEQGFSLVRAGQMGLMTVSDASGTVLAEDERFVVAEVPTGPVGTIYDRFGNWFLMPVIAALLGAVVLALVPRRDAERRVAPSTRTETDAP
ncbi:Apolipoprotein N-acyltransferase [Glycomyces sambucus]|uniref:Apolipoprotein N-acyltransferase n=1 Tax=Glycomyces sambucus TaxID=380244 RepID=A0A1G9FFL8_9ACTN|nr:hypothetical protein [Glycomyces sambucus]SDK87137.1 Apolipoprotein N-acyltransferase [Glycomyces sambucus]